MEPGKNFTPEEVETLLLRRKERAVFSQDPEGADAASEKRVVAFDPRKPNRLSKSQILNLTLVFKAATDPLVEGLKQAFRLNLEAEITGVTQERYEAFIGSLPDPCCLYRVDFAPMKAPALLVPDHALVFAMVDGFLGGTGEAAVEPRRLTEVEEDIVDQFIGVVIQKIAEAWGEIAALHPEIEERISEPEQAAAAGVDEILLVIDLAFSGQESLGVLKICFPFTALEEYIDRIGVQKSALSLEPKDLTEWMGKIEHKLVKVEVGLPVVLGAAAISINELLDLKKQDVIVLGKKINEPVEMPVGSEAVIRGNVGLYNHRLAVKVMEIRKRKEGVEEEGEAHG